MTIVKWLALLALPVLAAVGVYQLVSTKEPEKPPVAASSPTPSAAPTESPSPIPSPSPSPVASPSPTVQAEGEGRLQVLNGSGTPGLGNKVADKLRQEGYEIVSTGNSVRRYEQTTVFYQPGSEALAREVSRFLGTTKIEPAPDNLDKKIPVTVVVGADYSDD